MTESTLGKQITDVHDLAHIVAKWYFPMMNELLTAAHLSPDAEIKGKLDPDGEEIIFEGNERKAFIAGVTYCIEQIGELPFVPQKEEVKPDEQAT